MPTISKLNIVNNALRELNIERINALTDNTKRAQVMNDIYDVVRLEMIEESPWNWATKRIKLTPDPTQPDFGWENRFALPADFISASREDDDEKYEIEGRYLLADAEEVKLIYTADIQDTYQMPPMFIKALYLELAVRAAHSLGQDKSHKQILVNLAEAALAKARSSSAQQDDSDINIDAESIIDARRT